MAIERVIKERGNKAFLARNNLKGDGMFNIYTGAFYRLYDRFGDLWMTVAVRRQPGHGIVVTDVDSGLMVVVRDRVKTYDDAVRDVVRQEESISKARATEFYDEAFELCQEEYARLREWGVLK